MESQIADLARKYPKKTGHEYKYGTAGFRMDASLLDPIAVSVSLLAILRSRAVGGHTVGIMITASHNPPKDNGMKVVEPMGEMLVPSWEAIAAELANADDLSAVFLEQLQKSDKKAKVVIGMDTRESSPRLSNICKETFNSLKDLVDFVDIGYCTTPQLHYITRCYNDPSFGTTSIEGYHEKLGLSLKKIASLNSFDELPEIVIDGANGIGSLQMDEFLKINKDLKWNVRVVNSNTENPEALNVNCGADYVKTNQRAPQGSTIDEGQLGASFDGDADRIVFYYLKNGHFHLLDGDRIAILLAEFISKLVSKIDVEGKIGIVQTAYANGASTNYIEKILKLPVVCAKTGVKHLHHEALQFDIGVYFEANGHGTVLFKPDFVSRLQKLESSASRDSLLLLVDLINQTVGDSMSDLLAVITALKYSDIDGQSWFAMYEDLPNKLYKVLVNDRFVFVTTDAERKLTAPEGLQGKIDATVTGFDAVNGRCFVRASGTEDAVRVYSEASTSEKCAQIGDAVCDLLKASGY